MVLSVLYIGVTGWRKPGLEKWFVLLVAYRSCLVSGTFVATLSTSTVLSVLYLACRAAGRVPLSGLFREEKGIEKKEKENSTVETKNCIILLNA